MFSRKKRLLLAAALVLAVDVFVAIAFVVFTGREEIAATVNVIPMAEALDRVGKGENVVLLDVRTPEEYAAGNLPGSLLLPVDAAEVFGPQVAALIPDKNATVFVYCRSGRRSQNAAEIMARMGYRAVYNIGGMNDVPKTAVE